MRRKKTVGATGENSFEVQKTHFFWGRGGENKQTKTQKSLPKCGQVQERKPAEKTTSRSQRAVAARLIAARAKRWSLGRRRIDLRRHERVPSFSSPDRCAVGAAKPGTSTGTRTGTRPIHSSIWKWPDPFRWKINEKKNDEMIFVSNFWWFTFLH